MKFHEHQAKERFAAYGIPTQTGVVIERPEQLDGLAVTHPVVLKAQVLVGGRGKAGGVKLARTPGEARETASQILGMSIKGEVVRRVLVVPAAEIQREYYLAFTVDRSAKRLAAIASASGGVDIEEVARTTPDRIHTVLVDPVIGFRPFHARALGRRLGFEGQPLAQFAAIAANLARLAVEMDAELAEINPLAQTPGGLLAVDAKLIVDDNALFRQPGLPENRELTDLEALARAEGLSYVELDGDIAIIGNGAGLVMSALDMVAYFGGRPANFCDVGGGATAENMREAIDIVLRKPGVRALFIDIFGGITRGEEVARGIVQNPPRVPASIRLTGTNEEEGRRILEGAGIRAFVDPEEAARAAVALAAGAASPAIKETR